jgi:hypothetical protein
VLLLTFPRLEGVVLTFYIFIASGNFAKISKFAFCTHSKLLIDRGTSLSPQFSLQRAAIRLSHLKRNRKDVLNGLYEIKICVILN